MSAFLTNPWAQPMPTQGVDKDNLENFLNPTEDEKLSSKIASTPSIFGDPFGFKPTYKPSNPSPAHDDLEAFLNPDKPLPKTKSISKNENRSPRRRNARSNRTENSQRQQQSTTSYPSTDAPPLRSSPLKNADTSGWSSLAKLADGTDATKQRSTSAAPHASQQTLTTSDGKASLTTTRSPSVTLGFSKVPTIARVGESRYGAGPGLLFRGRGRHDNDHESILNISIMPTVDEIKSSHIDYRPLADPSTWHKNGTVGVIDRAFRLFRDIAVAPIRRIAQIELKRLDQITANAHAHAYTPQDSGRRSQASGAHVYTNLRVECITGDPDKGLYAQISFDQPAACRSKSEQRRQEWWQNAHRLSPGSLIGLFSQSQMVIFGQTHWRFAGRTNLKKERKPVPPQELFEDRDRAKLVVHFIDFDRTVAKDLLIHFFPTKQSDAGNLFLMEFPDNPIILFHPTLSVLKGLVLKRDLPFQEMLVPNLIKDNQHQDQLRVAPPGYMQQKRFDFQIKSVCRNGAEIRFNVNSSQRKIGDALHCSSTLDRSQAGALVSTLSRSLSLIQGPPGTGKSFTGVTMIRAMLENKTAAGLGPIVCVCYTNHALDQLLESLDKQGVNRIIRFGSNSESLRLSDRLWSEVKPKKGNLGADRARARKDAAAQVKQAVGRIHGVISGIRPPSESRSVRIHLHQFYPHHYKQLFGSQMANDQQDAAIDKWLSKGTIKTSSTDRSVDALKKIDLNLMSKNERQSLLKCWISEVADESAGRLMGALARHKDAKMAHEAFRKEVDVQFLQEADVIGLTNVGLAVYRDLILALKPKILVCEEAGEVVEAHALTSLLPCLEHAILIGDHKQLRPTIDNHELSVEFETGQFIAADKSLFERLVAPDPGYAAMPLETLSVQRRMHPKISSLIKGLYPTLADAGTDYPEIPGMAERLFWLDHRHSEARPGTNPAHPTSQANHAEAALVVALAHHILSQGVFAAGEVAIISPYIAQTDQISRSMAAVHGRFGLDGSIGNMASAVRISSVDNFQGEEAKVVIISLVRSNSSQKVGFLKTSNRINVLLSRAKHGMYIVGDAECVSGIPIWNEVIQKLEKDHLIDDALPITCPQHPEVSPAHVNTAEEFKQHAPHGGCTLPCNRGNLPCGHPCPSVCHSELHHRLTQCEQHCTGEAEHEIELEAKIDEDVRSETSETSINWRPYLEGDWSSDEDAEIDSEVQQDPQSRQTARDTDVEKHADTNASAGLDKLVDISDDETPSSLLRKTDVSTSRSSINTCDHHETSVNESHLEKQADDASTETMSGPSLKNAKKDTEPEMQMRESRKDKESKDLIDLEFCEKFQGLRL